MVALLVSVYEVAGALGYLRGACTAGVLAAPAKWQLQYASPCMCVCVCVSVSAREAVPVIMQGRGHSCVAVRGGCSVLLHVCRVADAQPVCMGEVMTVYTCMCVR